MNASAGGSGCPGGNRVVRRWEREARSVFTHREGVAIEQVQQILGPKKRVFSWRGVLRPASISGDVEARLPALVPPLCPARACLSRQGKERSEVASFVNGPPVLLGAVAALESRGGSSATRRFVFGGCSSGKRAAGYRFLAGYAFTLAPKARPRGGPCGGLCAMGSSRGGPCWAKR